MQVDPKQLVEQLLDFVENYTAGRAAMSQQTCDQLAQFLIYYMDFQAECRKSKKKLDAIKETVKIVIEDDSIEGGAKLSLVQEAILGTGSTALKEASLVLKSAQAFLEQEICTLKSKDEELEVANDRLSAQVAELELKLAQADTLCERSEKELKEQNDEILKLRLELKSLTESHGKKVEQLEEEAQGLLQKVGATQAQMAKSEAEYLAKLLNEKKELEGLRDQLLKRDDDVKNLESKLAQHNLELFKKGAKISQMASANQILQTQLEEVRAETEKERSVLENEVMELKALLAEKSKQIEQLEAEKADDAANDETDPGTLASSNLDNPYDIDFDSLMQSSAIVQANGPGSPRHSVMRTRMSTVDMRSRRVSINKPPSLASEKHELSAKPSASSKETQTVEAQTAAGPLSLAQDPALLQQVEELRARVGDLEARLSAAGLQAEKQLRASESQIESLTTKLMNISMESSQIINEINSQYQEALKQLKRAKGR